MKKLFVSASAAVVAMALATPAFAMDVIEINPLTATWSNAVGAAVNFAGQGTPQATVSWGSPASSAGQSAYRFTSEVLPISKAFSAGGTENFKMGTFEHINNPVFAPSITGVRLTLDYGISINGSDLGMFSSVFDFVHTETPNTNDPCPFGGSNGFGVNANGCADRVTFSVNKGLSDRFTVGGIGYLLNIGGFSDGQGGVLNEFLTVEGSNNLAELVGSVSVVPEPASWAMLIAGFGLVGATMRRRRQQGVHVLA